MNEKNILRALGNVDNQYIKEAEPMKKQGKKITWQKWAAMAACLCLVVCGAFIVPTLTDKQNVEEPMPSQEELPPVIDEGPAGMTMAEINIVEINGIEYFVYSNEDKDILQNYGIPTELTEDLAGEHVCYLDINNNRFVACEKADSSEENDIELFEYAPEPNENVYIMCRSGEYFAVIRK